MQGGKYGKGRHSILIKQDVKPFAKRDIKKAKRLIDLSYESFYGKDERRKSEVRIDQKQQSPENKHSDGKDKRNQIIQIGDVRKLEAKNIGGNLE